MKNTKKFKSGNTHRTSNERLEKEGGDEGLSTFSVCFSYNLWENPDSPWAPGENPRWPPSREFGKSRGQEERPQGAGLPDGKVVTAAAELHGLRAQRTNSGNGLIRAPWPLLQKWRWGHLVNHRWGGTTEESCKLSTQPALMRTRHPEVFAELAGREWGVSLARLKPPLAKEACAAWAAGDSIPWTLWAKDGIRDANSKQALRGLCQVCAWVTAWPIPQTARRTCEKCALAPFRPQSWGYEGGTQRRGLCSKSISPLPGISSLAQSLALRNGRETAPGRETWGVVPWTSWDTWRPSRQGSFLQKTWVQSEVFTFERFHSQHFRGYRFVL